MVHELKLIDGGKSELNEQTGVSEGGGFIALYRSLLDSPFAADPEAVALFVRLMLKASHAQHTQKVGNRNIVINRGQMITGRKALSIASGISEKKIRNLLDYFENDGMITRISTSKHTLITVENYDKWQAIGASKMGQQKGHQKGQLEAAPALGLADIQGQQKGQQKGQHGATNNNDNNIILPNGSCQNSDELCPDQPEDSESIIKPCPHTKIIDLYHETLPELPKVLKPRWNGSARARDLQARWKESPQHQSREFWQAYFSAVRKIPHQMGNNDRGWKADLGWLVKRGNFDKMIERFVNQGLWK